MEKNFIPYGKQKITEEDINSVVKVLRSDFITQGDKVPEFEQLICMELQNYVQINFLLQQIILKVTGI